MEKSLCEIMKENYKKIPQFLVNAKFLKERKINIEIACKNFIEYNDSNILYIMFFIY